jgi:hypothetical protein
MWDVWAMWDMGYGKTRPSGAQIHQFTVHSIPILDIPSKDVWILEYISIIFIV